MLLHGLCEIHDVPVVREKDYLTLLASRCQQSERRQRTIFIEAGK
jgi:hypothetical protein